MSASGFTWIYLTILTMMAGAAGLLEPRYVKVALELGYVIIIGPVLGSGLAITIDSWTTAIREKSTLGYGVAAWNTFAQVHNTYEAISLLPDIIDDLSDTLSGDGDSDNAGPAVLVLLIVLFALAGGAFTTAAIVRHTAREYAVDVRRAAKAA